MIEDLRLICSKLVSLNKNNEGNLRKYELIQEILTDNKCFFKIDIKYAYSILRDLGIQEESIKDYYTELIDIKNY
ncbi:MAG: hypothetical protein NC181_02950 [Clostridium sp.]|nr:hypothetical protein [Clostridium sp.]MCM1444195.1 hypothetical protein [Candidatus Amulumruptor caecigallinarius]